MPVAPAAFALIGFGEAGGILGQELAARGCSVRSYDILLDGEASRPAMLARMQSASVQPASTLAGALAGAQYILSAVTADSAAAVAHDAAPHLAPGQVFLDINSVSPETKRSNAAAIDAGGGDYVDVAVMAPVPPKRLAVPLLLSGARAAELSAVLAALGFSPHAVGSEVGKASAIKMCRSVVIKGLEALAVESLFTARRYGAEDAVLASLAASFPGMGWDAHQPDYLISRVAEHGRRRAAELREVAATVRTAGLMPLMSEAIAERQDTLIDQMQAAGIGYDPATPFSWRELADRLLKP